MGALFCLKGNGQTVVCSEIRFFDAAFFHKNGLHRNIQEENGADFKRIVSETRVFLKSLLGKTQKNAAALLPRQKKRSGTSKNKS